MEDVYAMTRISKEITIQAPVGKVFGFVCKPSNLPRVWRSLVEIKDEQILENGKCSFNWRYEMGGILLVGSGKITDIAPSQWIVAEMDGSVKCTMTFAFRSLGRITKLFLTVDYQIPIPIVGWLVGKSIIKLNEQEADTMMSNIRTSCEHITGPLLLSTGVTGSA